MFCELIHLAEKDLPSSRKTLETRTRSLGYFGHMLDFNLSQVEAHYAYDRLHTRDNARQARASEPRPRHSLSLALCNIVVVFNGFSLSQSTEMQRKERVEGMRQKQR